MKTILAQVFLCQGSSCGAEKAGKMAAPGEALREQWKQAGINSTVRLSLSKCLGCCELANNICVITPDQSQWIGQLNSPADFDALLAWGKEALAKQKLAPLPSAMQERQFSRLQKS